ncbi:MAG: hypothetical protein AAFN30_16770 [Actinomycetota bacterium]
MAHTPSGHSAGDRGPGGGPIPGVAEQELTSLRFAAVARRLSEAARAAGAEVPAFRSPPRAAGVQRSIRRERSGAATVAVSLRGRPGVAVIADMIDGVIAAAALEPGEASSVRDQLWSTAARFLDAEAADAAEPPLVRQAA